MTDGRKRATTPAAAARRRVSTRMAALVVPICGLIGYGLSFALPLHSTPLVAGAEQAAEEADTAAAAPALEAIPSKVAAVPAQTPDVAPEPRPTKAPEVTTDVAPAPLPMQKAKVAARDPVPAEATSRISEAPPAAVEMPPPPAVQTGSLTLPAAATATPRAEPARSHVRARELRRKRFRRAYLRRRPAPSQPGNPVQALWSWMTK